MPKERPTGEPWLQTVETAREAFSGPQERWRLSALESIPHWREFVVLWASQARPLARCARGSLVPASIKDTEDRLAYAWGLVEDEAASVLFMIDQITGLSSQLVLDLFDRLRQAGVIFPDGTVHRYAMDRISSEQELIDRRVAAATQKAIKEAVETNQQTQRLLSPTPVIQRKKP